MDDEFEKKLSLSDSVDRQQPESPSSSSTTTSATTLQLLRKFLAIQKRRALAYSKLKKGFAEYIESGGELAYQQLCSEITVEFNDCSKQVIEMESMFRNPPLDRVDLADLIRIVQLQEKDKLQLTATIQVLKKAGRPSERLVNHGNCKHKIPLGHECVHIHDLTEAAGTEEAEADAEYDNALNEAIQSVQVAVDTINESIENVRYEMADLLESATLSSHSPPN